MFTLFLALSNKNQRKVRSAVLFLRRLYILFSLGIFFVLLLRFRKSPQKYSDKAYVYCAMVASFLLIESLVEFDIAVIRVTEINNDPILPRPTIE